jgi:dUTP pyrophosphatase
VMASTNNPPMNIPQLSAEEKAWFASHRDPAFDTTASTINSGAQTTSATTTTTTTANPPASTVPPQLTLDEEVKKWFSDPPLPAEKPPDVAPDLGQMILPCRAAEHFSIILLRESAVIPRQYGSKKSLWDLSASEPSFIPAGTTGYVKTGLIIIPPLEKFTQLHSRSGLAAHGVTVEGGIIDEDYKKEVFIILKNSTPHNITIQAKQRVAQFSFYDNPAGWYVMRVQNETAFAQPPPQRKNIIENPVGEGGAINDHLSQKEIFESFPAFMHCVKNQGNPGVLDPNAPKRMAEPCPSKNRGFGSTGYF